ncbi:MAG TPA: hypothetical protein VH087_00715 [Thermoanaerobaculia bacterium]|nr:hypothetical protein [Thermoanaerobaculia bacterium]
MKISRRAFGSLIAASALVRGAPAEAADAAPNAEVEARIHWVFTKYGSRLNDEQRADVRRIISGGQPAIDAMRAYPLGNEVGPPVPFRVYTGKRRRPPAKLEGK